MISIDEFDGKRYQIRIVEPNNNGKAVLTHYDLGVSLSGRAFRCNLLLFKEKSKRIFTSIPNAKAA